MPTGGKAWKTPWLSEGLDPRRFNFRIAIAMGDWKGAHSL